MSSPSPVRDNIRALMEKRNLSKRQLSLRAGLGETTVKDIFNGNSPTVKTLEKLAETLAVDIKDFFAAPHETEKRTVTPLPIKGEVCTGKAVSAVEWPSDQWQEEIFPSDPRFAGLPRFGMVISDKTMDLHYDQGDLVACIKMADLKESAESGRRYIAINYRSNGKFEVICRELLIDDDGTEWLLAKPKENKLIPPLQISPKSTELYARVTGHWGKEG